MKRSLVVLRLLLLLLPQVMKVTVATMFLSASYFGHVYRRYPPSSSCPTVPPGRVLFVLGFEYRRFPGGSIDPGPANDKLAQWAAECAGNYAGILVQKAVLVSLANQRLLDQGATDRDAAIKGTPVSEMHLDNPEVSVRTFQALRCGLDRVPTANGVALLSHDKMAARALRDLRTLYRGEISEVGHDPTPYLSDHPWAPMTWAMRELFLALPADAMLRFSTTHPNIKVLTPIVKALGGLDCPDAVRADRVFDVQASQAASIFRR